MIKKLLYVFLLGILSIKPLYANEDGEYGSPSETMTYYYQNKDINLALDIIQKLSDAEVLENYQHSFMPITGFIAGIIAENDNAQEKIKELPVSFNMKESVSTAEQLLQDYPFDDILSNPDNIDDEKDLDLLWGIFFATGNPKIPETIHAFVEKNKISTAPSGGKSKKDVVVMSAIWSLESNAQQHEIVKPYATFPKQLDGNGNQNIITFYKEIQKHN